MPRVVSFIVLLAVIILIGSMFFQVMVQFIVPLFLAAVLVVIFKPLHLWVTGRIDNRPRIAAAVTTFLIVLIVLLPLCGVAVRAFSEAAKYYASVSEEPDSKASISGNQIAQQQPVPAEEKQTPADEEEASTDGDTSAEKMTLTEEDTSAEGEAPAIIEAEDQVAADEEKPKGPTVDKNALLSAVEAIVPLVNDRLREWQLPLLKVKQLRDYLAETVERVAAPLALGGVRVVASTLFSVAIMILALYYFFADGPNMVTALMKLSPMDDAYEQELLDKFSSVSRSVVVAVLLSAVAQGILAGLGYFFAGVHNVFICTVLTTVFAMVPFVGATIVWIPICLVLYFYTGEVLGTEVVDGVTIEKFEYPEGRPTAAILLAIYCTTVVSMVDNLIKPLVLHGQANLHPLLALLSVIGGIQALGPIGILVGPMLVAFLQALLNMLNKELKLLGQESDRTGKPVVFATDDSDEPSDPPAVLPTSQPSKKRKRKRKK